MCHPTDSCKDWICNYLGVERTISKVEFDGASEFAAAALTDYMLNGTSYGEFKTAQNLNYLKVHAAGHEVAYYRKSPNNLSLLCLPMKRSLANM